MGQQIIRSTLVVSFCILLSRIAGYIRDAVIASLIGTGLANDAFLTAFKLTNLFRTVFGEGAFGSVFVPIFSRLRKTKGEKQARAFAVYVKTMLLLFLIAFSLLMIINMRQVIKFTTPGFADNAPLIELAVRLGRITFPYLTLISLAALYGGILNSYGNFFPYASTSILMNIITIAGVIILAGRGIEAVYALSYAIVIAGISELLWILFWARRKQAMICRLRLGWNRHLSIFTQRIGPAIITSGITQFNIWIDMLLVSFVPCGMSYIYYADRLVQLPYALIGTAIAAAILPNIAELSDEEKRSQISEILNKCTRYAMFLGLPSAAALIYFDRDALYLLFYRGAFDATSVQQSARALSCIAVGLPSFILTKIINNLFYGMGDVRNPAKIALISAICNASIGWLLLGPLQHVGVAAGMVCAGYVSLGLSLFILHRSYTLTIDHFTLADLGKSLGASLAMITVIAILDRLLFNNYLMLPDSWLLRLLIIGRMLFSGTTYLLACWLFKSGTLRDILSYIRCRRSLKPPMVSQK